MLKLNCTGCGHTFQLDADVYSDYKGLVKCNTCHGVVAVELLDGRLKSLDFRGITRPSKEEEFLRRM